MKYMIKNYSKWKGPYAWGCHEKLSKRESIHEDFSAETALDLEVAVDVAREYFDAPEGIEEDGMFDPEKVKKMLSEVGVRFKSSEYAEQAIGYYKWRAEKFLEAKAFLEAGKLGVWKVDIPAELNAYETGIADKLAKPLQEEAWISVEISEGDAL